MSQCAYSLDGASWTDLPVGPQFDLGIGVDEQNTELITDGGAIWTERLFERDLWNLTFKIETANVSAFQALHDAVDGQLGRLFITLDRTADPVVAIYGWKEAGFALEGTGERVIPPVFNYRLSISGETMSLLALLRSYEFDELPAAPGPGALARVSDAPGGLWMYSGEQWVRVGRDINVKDAPFNATGDGSTDDTVAVQAALDAAEAVGCGVYFPAGTYRLLEFTIPSNCKVYGDGQGATTLKAVDGAVLNILLNVPTTSSNVRVRDLTMDGNRDNAGMVDAFSAPCNVGGTDVTFEQCEITRGTFTGAFVGADAEVAKNVTFEGCYIHDNGGVTDDAGNGVGISSGGVMTPQDIKILNCVIKGNHNTITKPNDSSGVNLEVKGVRIQGCTFEDNFNVAGGQIVIHGDNGDGICDADICDNTIRSTTNFGTPTDRTEGIEIQGKKFNISRNKMYLMNTDASGISVGTEPVADGGFGIIEHNEIEGCGQGIALSNNTPLSNVIVDGNRVDAIQGIGTSDTHSYINIINNDFSACGQPQAGTVSATTNMQNNLPFIVSNSANGRTHTQAVGVLSAAHLTLGNGNENEISGTDDIELIDSTGWYKGDIAYLTFDSSLTVRHGMSPSGAFKPILLLSSADLVVGSFDTLTLKFTGTLWLQVAASDNA